MGFASVSTVEELKRSLEPFLTDNPSSSIGSLPFPPLATAVIEPWGDSTIAIDLGSQTENLVAALNRVILPERLTGMWHKQTKAFEVIYTAVPLTGSPSAEVYARAFDFNFDGKTYRCEFRDSSPELLLIADAYTAAGPFSSTNHRNLGSFQRYVRSERGQAGYSKLPDARPLSFWITGLENWSETVSRALVQHLNFYMKYYDQLTPVILVHASKSESEARTHVRYPFNDFPKAINARTIDDVRLNFWMAAQTGDPARRFLYNYQIIEFSAFSYIESQIKNFLKRAIAAPNSTNNLDQTAQACVEIMGMSKLHDSQKIDALIQDVVDPRRLWKEIEANIGFFSRSCQFEGGFSVPPIAKIGWTEEDFVVNGKAAFSGTLRKMRNALSHGREQKPETAITPTQDNLEKLQFWVPLAEVTAAEVMMFGELS